MDCPKCKKETEHVHIHTCPYGIAGAHIAGTERYECKECGYAMFKEEGTSQGLEFVLD